ncbi:hypothetical protein M0R45_022866 [Rubus argutus]|uniref:Ubiquitin-like protease family profile domain-containing protein n=1 Tax=Rubus argutus TaxID=59490 RepID=A0AAW1XHK8_RUBAR
MDPKVLTYNSVVLRRSDLDLLRGPHYLNDCIIEFYFSYVSNYLCNDDILLVSPTMSFWLANSEDSEATFRDFEESNQLGKKQVVIFTVNDNQDTSKKDGGNHWSLLVYYRKSNAFVHYDSLGGLNNLVARKFYGAVKKYVAVAPAPTPPTPTSSLQPYQGHKYNSKRLRRIRNYLKLGAFVMMRSTYFSNKFHQFRNYAKKKKKIFFSKKYLLRDYHPTKNIIRARGDEAWKKVCYGMQKRLINNNNNGDDDDDKDDPWFREETVMPRQTNMYDCGLYVMSVARVICQWYYQPADEEHQQNCFLGDDRFPNIIKHLDNSLEYTMRSQLLRLIQHLAS